MITGKEYFSQGGVFKNIHETILLPLLPNLLLFCKKAFELCHLFFK
jgi:hypothetical protein